MKTGISLQDVLKQVSLIQQQCAASLYWSWKRMLFKELCNNFFNIKNSAKSHGGFRKHASQITLPCTSKRICSFVSNTDGNCLLSFRKTAAQRAPTPSLNHFSMFLTINTYVFCICWTQNEQTEQIKHCWGFSAKTKSGKASSGSCNVVGVPSDVICWLEEQVAF